MLNGLNKQYALLLIVCILTLFSCKQEKKYNQLSKADSVKKKITKEWSKTIPGNFSDQTKAVFDSSQIAAFLKKYPAFNAYANDINLFYSKRKFAYAWYANNVLIEQAGNLSDRLTNLQNEGIYKAIPYPKTLDSLIFDAHPKTTQAKTNITTELMLTAQYFVFSKFAFQGMSDSVTRAVNWYLPRKKVSYNDYLDSLLKKPAKPDGTLSEPVYRQYDLLKRFLARYRQLDATEKWVPIITDKKLKPGDSSVVISLIKKRLYKLDDFKGDTLNNVYDNELKEAFKQFQLRHGLTADGVAGPGTIAELNVSLKARIQQIIVNMERCRWLPVSLNTDYLAVNIPEFKLHVYHADSLLWSCNVVVGQKVHQTVIFYGLMQYVVFSPYWNLPESIIRNEVLPEIKRNPNYISRHNMIITGKLNGLPVIKQKPGPANSLGLVKFLFPNSYSIYLHDTPSKSLFGESSRAFSHGCIRVGEPAKLASFLLKYDTTWTTARISKAMHLGKEQQITLKQKTPVFIAYFTAFTDRANKLNFRKDIYNRDRQLASMILSGRGSY
ncbi:L,D-transpeptidase family protein [Mucilaginibacter sabulilitoris]|uniref:L,D-transpeptidase family protein n=1 Tax=Mucilaginibacter sabulilitoris TaxID=1173583 RepID=A0ABZ0TCV4_9SPHI|nr:L,D-transpeptidase family protein [Mucilaginibacter sabulilitoris]WPU91046.1 L,D-transpeptidase family protein [Mucilaginibacter sabulilitoris]